MCVVSGGALLGLLSGGGATAAGATAGAATIGSTLLQAGTALAAGATLYSGIATARAASETEDAIEVQRQTRRQIAGVEEQESRRRFMTLLRRQSGELLARGVTLDSPTAVALGQQAAQEASFDAQAIRAEASADDIELSSQQRALRARGRSALFTGGLSAAGGVLNASPDLWPELYA
ncbi:MAG: hypothetical protein AAFX07_00545 [Pseudomonadota bacterium]